MSTFSLLLEPPFRWCVYFFFRLSWMWLTTRLIERMLILHIYIYRKWWLPVMNCLPAPMTYYIIYVVFVLYVHLYDFIIIIIPASYSIGILLIERVSVCRWTLINYYLLINNYVTTYEVHERYAYFLLFNDIWVEVF